MPLGAHMNNDTQKRESQILGLLGFSEDDLNKRGWGGYDESPVGQQTLTNFLDMLATLPNPRGASTGRTGAVGVVYEEPNRYMYIELKDGNASIYFNNSVDMFCLENIAYTDMLSQAVSAWASAPTLESC